MASRTDLIGPNDDVVAVVGMTGSGKSTFIQHFTENKISIGHTLESCTADIATYQCCLPDGRKVYLMDSPGFDDTSRSDTDILHDIANVLEALRKHPQLYNGRRLLAGIVYLHPLSNSRFPGSALKNLRMFKKLCGDDAFPRVVLATTMWDLMDPRSAERRENEIMNKPDFWKLMIERGSRVFRLDRGKESAATVIEYLISCEKK